MQILRLSEIEFIQRVMSDPSNKWSEKRAKMFYSGKHSLWELLIDQRTKERRNKLGRKNVVRHDCELPNNEVTRVHHFGSLKKMIDTDIIYT